MTQIESSAATAKSSSELPAELTAELTAELINQARLNAINQGRSLIAVLEELSSLEAEAFSAKLAELFAYPCWSMAQLQAGTPAFDLLPFTDCAQHDCVLMKQDDGALVLVIGDPFQDALLQWADYQIKQAFVVALTHASDLAAYLTQQENAQQAMQEMLADAEDVPSLDQTIEDISLVKISEDSSPVVKLVNSTLYDALKFQASDIHLECDVASLVIKYRVDGVLVQAGQVQGLQMAEQIISRIKVMADLDIGERRVPQDGRFKVRVKGSEIDFRVSIMPNIFGE
ncbi:MAG: hypothetical protein RL748_4511, partial [Pseudomonadota bacterium]